MNRVSPEIKKKPNNLFKLKLFIIIENGKKEAEYLDPYFKIYDENGNKIKKSDKHIKWIDQMGRKESVFIKLELAKVRYVNDGEDEPCSRMLYALDNQRKKLAQDIIKNPILLPLLESKQLISPSAEFSTPSSSCSSMSAEFSDDNLANELITLPGSCSSTSHNISKAGSIKNFQSPPSSFSSMSSEFILDEYIDSLLKSIDSYEIKPAGEIKE